MQDFKKNKKIIFWLIKVFVPWRLFLVLISFLAQQILPFKPSFPFSETFLKPFGPQLLWIWGNFDGVRYISLGQYGYLGPKDFGQTFFPLYPFLINKFSIFFNPLIAALIISNTAFFVALFILFKLITLDFSQKIAKKTIVFLLIFPTSFFFGAVYSESLFLLLCLTAFYLAKRGKWAQASLAGFLASTTRLIGVFLFPALFFEQSEQKKTKTSNQLLLFIIPSGLLLFMAYLKRHFNDFLYFLHIQPLYGASRASDKIILIHQVIWRYLKMLFTIDKTNPIYPTLCLEFLTSLLFIFLLIQLIIKKYPSSYITFSILSFITPTLTGTFSSMPRHVLILFPCFIVLSQIISKRNLTILWILINFILLVLFCGLFTRGYWVAWAWYNKG